jgi:hypothetical protein
MNVCLRDVTQGVRAARCELQVELNAYLLPLARPKDCGWCLISEVLILFSYSIKSAQHGINCAQELIHFARAILHLRGYNEDHPQTEQGPT